MHAFQVREYSGYITGLSFHFTPAPMISAFDLKYELPPEIKPHTLILGHTRIANTAHFAINQFVKLDREKTFDRLWSNSLGQLKGVAFRGYNTNQGVLSGLVPLPSISIKEVGGKTEFGLSTTNANMGIPQF